MSSADFVIGWDRRAFLVADFRWLLRATKGQRYTVGEIRLARLLGRRTLPWGSPQ